MDFNDQDRSDFLALIKETYHESGYQVLLGPTQDELKSRFNILSDLINKFGKDKFVETYLQLLKNEDITMLDVELLFNNTELSKDLTLDGFREDFIAQHSINNINNDKLWKLPFHIENNKVLDQKYWDKYNSICMDFLETNLDKLNTKQLLSGLKRCHSGCEWGLETRDLEMLTLKIQTE